MKKIAWRLTNNGRKGKDLREYDKTTYHCEADDAGAEIELPKVQENTSDSPAKML
jgi:hypothetical protein